MTDITITLDLAVVQQAIHAHVKPAVDKILAKYDLAGLVEKELLKKPEKSTADRFYTPYVMMNVMGYGFSGDSPKIDAIVSQEIRVSAEKFVKDHLKRDKANIEKAFVRMLRESPDSIAHAFLRSFEEALTNEWNFELKATVEPKQIERDYGE